MSSKPTQLTQAFLDKQRRRLTELRGQILRTRRGEVSEQASTNAEVNDHAHEFEDDAQRLAALELQDNLAAVDDRRLVGIERALQKIDDGTYGFSDGSGAPIPIDRLEAYPDALYTLSEQNDRDRRV